MRTKTQLKNKIAELKQWLQDNDPQHQARPQIERDLRATIEELKNKEKHE